jgi:DNA-binding NarL/FixJ family response regulator
VTGSSETRAEGGAELERRGLDAYLAADYRESVSFYERAYLAHRTEGHVLDAVRCARTIAYFSAVHGDWAVQSGWVARARSLLSEAEAGDLERAWLDLFDAFASSDLGATEVALRRAVASGRALDDPNLELDATALLGQHLVASGRVEEGMKLLDECLAAACAGEVDDLFVLEGIFCGMFTSCERTHDVPRAEQWMRAAESVVDRRGMRTLSAFCRAHYGGILTAAGRWTEAETELLASASVFSDAQTDVQSNALVRLADLKVAQGRYEEAEQLLDGLEDHPDAIRPLASLHLARGEVAAAKGRIEIALEGADEAAVAFLLPVLVDVYLELGSVDEAEGAAGRLQTLARRRGGYLEPYAALARGRVAFVAGSDARPNLAAALAGFARARLPLEVARARLELARALRDDSPEESIAEATQALDEFERLGAARYADVAAAFLRGLGRPVRVGPKGKGALTKREVEVLELLGHGLSNPEIADRLFIARKTVEHHVSRILTKLGLRSRAEAAAYSVREGSRKTGS